MGEPGEACGRVLPEESRLPQKAEVEARESLTLALAVCADLVGSVRWLLGG